MPTNSYRHICFTSYKESPPVYDREEIRYLIYQREKCPSTEKLHWQGYVEFNRKITFNTMKEILGDNSIHLESRRGTRDEAREYCMKKESQHTPFTEYGNWESGGQGARNDLHKLVAKIEAGTTDYELIKDNPEEVNKYMKFIKHARHIINEHKSEEYMKTNYKTITPNDNQNIILQHISTQNDRQITWVNDPIGNTGKTFLSKHLIASQGAIRFTNGRTNDIAYAYKNNPIVVFDFARTCEERINYQIIEDLKNGMIFSSKYESQCKIFTPPKIVIMANFAPNTTAMSADRWDIINLLPSAGNTNRASDK